MSDTPSSEPLIVVFVMPFTSDTETHYEQSVWLPAGTPISLIDLSTGLNWQGYAGNMALLHKFQAQPVATIGQKNYSITGAQEFLTFGNLPAAEGMTLTAHLFLAIVQKSAEKDVDTGQKDADGNAVMAGFFDGAAMMYFNMITGELTPYTVGS